MYELLITIKESIIEGDAHLIRVQRSLLLSLSIILLIFGYHLLYLCLKELGEPVFEVGGDLSAILSMAITH
jgi:hypothetical protein